MEDQAAEVETVSVDIKVEVAVEVAVEGVVAVVGTKVEGEEEVAVGAAALTILQDTTLLGPEDLKMTAQRKPRLSIYATLMPGAEIAGTARSAGKSFLHQQLLMPQSSF